MLKLFLTLLLVTFLLNFSNQACDPSKLFDAELSLLFDDALPFDLIPKRMEYPLNTQRFTNAKLVEGLQFFKTRFGIDLNVNSQKEFRLEKGSFEGYSVVGAVTKKSRFFGSPLIRVYADMLTVVSLNSTQIDPLTQYPIPKDAIAQFGYYSFYYRANNTLFTEPIKVTSQTFQEGWRDAQQNLDHSRNIIFDLYSPEWGVGSSQGVVTMPMHDSTLGKSQVSMREWLRFPPVGTAKRGDVTTCQSWLN
ncbi:predicted protein [Naegleria gruberi]|uniref:Predicted protein n=1 Tax=Naegleria gruberi TaxID=5762 RepID=D2VLP7_NAEGR|nr:uncharacterized protein NAEGRDRAFT_69855 [Naegleria gruberi]EFC42097.1 predicted protein [Naegleria gruberi]|eukprot:XP_002674841.1 predicted protein [Naegleria gruberi strain NEG-M]